MMLQQTLWKRFHQPAKLGSIFLALLLFAGFQMAFAQFQVRGTVTDKSDGAPITGANIVELGTLNGTSTDAQGRYSLSVSSGTATIRVTFIGFTDQIIQVSGRNTINVQLAADRALLDEVVVTALGIEKQQKALGYSVAEISGEDIALSRENNVANALAGKVAGVNVTKPATGPGASSRVIIRGNNTFGDNQPLYVVDGIPIDNSNYGQAGEWGGRDAGDGVGNLNPDDIESFSVLKGDAAAALYGSRALNGVVLITTKKGVSRNGVGVEFNTNLTWDQALVTTDWQQEYGQGDGGEKPADQTAAIQTGLSSWGAKLDGSNVIQFDGVSRPYSAVPNNVKEFYQPGLNATNTLAFAGGNDRSTFRLSLSNLQSQGLVPNSTLDRNSINLRGTTQLGSKISIDAKVNYVTEYNSNRSNLSDTPGNPNGSVYRLPANVSVQSFNPKGEDPNDPNLEQEFNSNTYVTNPYWAAYHFRNSDDRDRVIGYISGNYKFTEWLSFNLRTGQDSYTLRSTGIEPYGTQYKKLGGMNERNRNFKERNTDFLFLAQKSFNNLGVSATFGGNRLNQTFEIIGSGGNDFVIPGLETVGNIKNNNPAYDYWEKRINSLYGNVDFAYNDYLFLNLTGRNDWSSTLPADNRSYFYPSVSLSYVISDAMELPASIDFLKLRASWANVGGDTSPYQLAVTYSLTSTPHLDQPLGTVQQGTIPLGELKPSNSVGLEAGLVTRFLNDRVGIDFGVYKKNVTNQILSADISSTSGYASRVINAGEIQNQGVELLLTTRPVQQRNLTWDFDINFAKNTNEVLSLQGNQTSLRLGQSRTLNGFVFAEVGQPFGVIKGYKFVRDASGNIVHDAAGFPMKESDLSVLGNANPDWTASISNGLRFNEFTVNALLDINWGGEIYSATNAFAYYFGTHKDTIEGRELGDNFIGEGVNESGGANTVKVNAQTYYQRFYNNYTEQFVYDASFIKLRSLTIGYRVPTSKLGGLPIAGLDLQLVGRNLLLLYSKVPNIDPESSYAANNSYGLEMYGVPQSRSFGFNANVRF